MTTEAGKALAEIVAGLEGVTPGPWYSDSIRSDGAYGSGEDVHEGFDAYAVYSEAVESYGKPAAICDTLNSDTGCIEEEFDEGGHTAWDEQGRKNMSHIARCDPSTLRLIADGFTALKAERDEARADAHHWRSNYAGFERAAKAIENQLGKTKAERDGWRKIVTDIAASVALPEVLRATGSAKDMIEYFEGLRSRAEAAETALATAKARIAELEGANEKLAKQIRAASQWYWPEDDTSSEACRESVREVFEYEPPGTIGAYSCGGVVYTRYYGWLPPSDDADSDDEFEVDEPTREAAEAKMAEEVARRAALESKP